MHAFHSKTLHVLFDFDSNQDVLPKGFSAITACFVHSETPYSCIHHSLQEMSHALAHTEWFVCMDASNENFTRPTSDCSTRTSLRKSSYCSCFYVPFQSRETRYNCAFVHCRFLDIGPCHTIGYLTVQVARLLGHHMMRN